MQQQAESDAQQAAYQSQQEIADLQAQMQAMQAQQAAAAAPAPAPAASAGGTDLMSQLQQLADMQAAGILTAEQFEAAKAKLLGA
jgi:hypothetical protein